VLRLFSVRGIPVAAHWSLLLAVGLFGWRAGSLAVGVVTAILLFTSVLLHELGHALVARRLHLPISGIDLHLFGGTAKMTAAPRSPREEVLVAVAGPAVSLGLAVAGFVGLALAPALAPVLVFVAWANLGLFLFNLLPALPMDGGRVLRALLASRFGFIDGTRRAVSVGVVVAVLMGLYGLWRDPWLVVMAFVIWSLGRAELVQVQRSVLLDRMGLSGADPWARYRRNARSADDAGGREPDTILLPDGTRVVMR
jgi:Zn-dependent protease